MLAALAAALVVTGCGAPVPGRGSHAASPGPSSSPSPSAPGVVTVAGHHVPAGRVHTVADALSAAGVVPPRDGRLLSIVSGRILDEHLHPGRIEIDGVVGTLSTPVRAGDVVTLVPGTDRVESTRSVTVPFALDAAAAALYVRYSPGDEHVVAGAISGEEVSSWIVRAPRVGKLKAPARFALTFDDGPSAAATTDVMSLLAAHDAPAVFCVIGDNAVAHPALVRQEAARGFSLCDHTQTHPLHLPDLTPTRIKAEIRDGYRSIVRTDGNVAPAYFRAPGGNWSPAVVADARALHLVPLRWTVDPRDWSTPGTPTIVTSVLDQLRPGGIVLLHDGGGDRTQTVAALRTLLDELLAAGWAPSLPSWLR